MTRRDALLLEVLDRLEDWRRVAPRLGDKHLRSLLRTLPPLRPTPGPDEQMMNLFGEIVTEPEDML